MRRALRWLEGVLVRREEGTTLALFRICCGLCALYIVIPMVLTDVHHLVLVDVHDGGYRPVSPNWLMNLLGGPTRTGVDRLCALIVIAGSAMALGLGGRLTCLVTTQLLMTMFQLNSGSGGGHDRLLTGGMWLITLSRSTETLSLDCWLRTRRWRSTTPIPAWPRFVAVYQLVLVYTTTGLQKLGEDWTPWGHYQALYKALLLPNWQRFDMSWIGPFYPLTQAATLGTLIFEIGAPVFLLAAFYRDTRERPGRLRALSNRLDLRRIWALIGFGLHLGIHIFMNVGPFSYVTLSFYACLWHPDEWAALGRRIRGRRAQTSP